MSSALNSIKQFWLVLAIISVTACGGGGGGSSNGSDVGNAAPVSSGDNVKQTSFTTDTTAPTSPITSSQNDASSEPSTSASQTADTTPSSRDDTATDTSTDASILNDPVFSSSEPMQEDNSLVDASSVDDPSAQVTATVGGYADLSWFIPDSREDGTYLPVYEISGYVVRYSTDNGATYKTIAINDAQTTDWRVENLAPGTYQFSIATIDTAGIHSQYSVPVSKQIL